MSNVVLGEFPLFSAKRDAVHVAVIPMKAAQELRPGQHVIVSGNVAIG